MPKSASSAKIGIICQIRHCMLYTALNTKYNIECIERHQVKLFNLLPPMSQHMLLIAVKLHMNK
jgi:hypothetical protein